jgi:glycosyltransferase involved in cell wall biosynthesis
MICNVEAVEARHVGMRETRSSVLILAGYYLPGFKGGGPIRSISNLISALGREFTFRVVTLDRDLQATSPYPGIPANEWVKTGKSDVMYLDPGWAGLLKMFWLLRSVDPSIVLYLNSFYSRRFSMFPIWLKCLGLIRVRCLVVAPRGEFSPGALQLRKARKRLYISLANILGLYRDVIWHASSQLEAEDIRKWFKEAKAIRIAEVISDAILSDMRTQMAPTDNAPKHPKVSGHLRVVFISRISPKKNLVGALSVLRGVSGKVDFHIYGPLEDLSYWGICNAHVNSLPPNVQVRYLGEVDHNSVPEIFVNYDLFLFPTLGENFGHVICESLSAGCPVIISDRTPWRGLSASSAGWDIPLDDMQEFHRALQSCIDADHESYERLREGARQYIRQYMNTPEIIDANRRLFQEARAVALASAG